MKISTSLFWPCFIWVILHQIPVWKVRGQLTKNSRDSLLKRGEHAKAKGNSLSDKYKRDPNNVPLKGKSAQEKKSGTPVSDAATERKSGAPVVSRKDNEKCGKCAYSKSAVTSALHYFWNDNLAAAETCACVAVASSDVDSDIYLAQAIRYACFHSKHYTPPSTASSIQLANKSTTPALSPVLPEKEASLHLLHYEVLGPLPCGVVDAHDGGDPTFAPFSYQTGASHHTGTASTSKNLSIPQDIVVYILTLSSHTVASEFVPDVWVDWQPYATQLSSANSVTTQVLPNRLGKRTIKVNDASSGDPALVEDNDSYTAERAKLNLQFNLQSEEDDRSVDEDDLCYQSWIRTTTYAAVKGVYRFSCHDHTANNHLRELKLHTVYIRNHNTTRVVLANGGLGRYSNDMRLKVDPISGPFRDRFHYSSSPSGQDFREPLHYHSGDTIGDLHSFATSTLELHVGPVGIVFPIIGGNLQSDTILSSLSCSLQLIPLVSGYASRKSATGLSNDAEGTAKPFSSTAGATSTGNRGAKINIGPNVDEHLDSDCILVYSPTHVPDMLEWETRSSISKTLQELHEVHQPSDRSDGIADPSASSSSFANSGHKENSPFGSNVKPYNPYAGTMRPSGMGLLLSDVLVLPIHNMLHQRSITVTIQLDYPAHYEAAEDHIRWQLRPASHRYDDADNKPQEGEEDHSSGCEYQYTGECVSPSRSSSTGTSTGYFLPPQVISIGPGQTKAVPLQLFPIDNYHSKGFGASDGSSWDKYSDMTEEDWLQDQLDREEMAATEGLGDDIPANDPSSGDDISSSSSPLGLLFARMLPCRRSGVVFNLIVTPSHGSQVQVPLPVFCRRRNESLHVSYLDSSGSVQQSTVLFPLLSEHTKKEQEERYMKLWRRSNSLPSPWTFFDTVCEQFRGKVDATKKHLNVEEYAKTIFPVMVVTVPQFRGRSGYKLLDSYYRTKTVTSVPDHGTRHANTQRTSSRYVEAGVEGYWVMLMPSSADSRVISGSMVVRAQHSLLGMQQQLHLRHDYLPQMELSGQIFVEYGAYMSGALASAAVWPDLVLGIISSKTIADKGSVPDILLGNLHSVKMFFRASGSIAQKRSSRALVRKLTEFYNNEERSVMADYCAMSLPNTPIGRQANDTLNPIPLCLLPVLEEKGDAASGSLGSSNTPLEKTMYEWITLQENSRTGTTNHDGGLMNDAALKLFYRNCLDSFLVHQHHLQNRQKSAVNNSDLLRNGTVTRKYVLELPPFQRVAASSNSDSSSRSRSKQDNVAPTVAAASSSTSSSGVKSAAMSRKKRVEMLSPFHTAGKDKDDSLSSKVASGEDGLDASVPYDSTEVQPPEKRNVLKGDIGYNDDDLNVAKEHEHLKQVALDKFLYEQQQQQSSMELSNVVSESWPVLKCRRPFSYTIFNPSLSYDGTSTVNRPMAGNVPLSNVHVGKCGVSVLQQQVSSSASRVKVACKYRPLLWTNNAAGKKDSTFGGSGSSILRSGKFKDASNAKADHMVCKINTENVRRMSIDIHEGSAFIGIHTVVINNNTINLSDAIPQNAEKLKRRRIEFCVGVEGGDTSVCKLPMNPQLEKVPQTSAPLLQLLSHPAMSAAPYAVPKEVYIVYGTANSFNSHQRSYDVLTMRHSLKDLAMFIANSIFSASGEVSGTVTVLTDVEYLSSTLYDNAETAADATFHIHPSVICIGGPEENKLMKLWVDESVPTAWSSGRKNRGYKYHANIPISFNASEGGSSAVFSVGPYVFDRATEGVITSFPIATIPQRTALSFAAQCICFYANGIEGYQHLTRLLWLLSSSMGIFPPHDNIIDHFAKSDFVVVDESVWYNGLGDVKQKQSMYEDNEVSPDGTDMPTDDCAGDMEDSTGLRRGRGVLLNGRWTQHWRYV